MPKSERLLIWLYKFQIFWHSVCLIVQFEIWIFLYIKRSSLALIYENRMLKLIIVWLSDKIFCPKSEQNCSDFGRIWNLNNFTTERKSNVRNPNCFWFRHSTVFLNLALEGYPWINEFFIFATNGISSLPFCCLP